VSSKRGLQLDDFFAVTRPPSDSWWYLAVSDRVGEKFSPERLTVVGGEWSKRSPIPLRIMKGSKQPGWIDSDTRMHLVSGPFAQALKQAGCTGFKMQSVVVRDRRDDKIVDKDCKQLVLSAGAGPVDQTRGGPAWIFHKSDDINELGVFFDPSTWDGKDVFYLSDYKKPIFSRKAAEAVMAAKLPGVIIEPCPIVGAENARTHPAFFAPRGRGNRPKNIEG
jgi:hypothetical protein